MSFTNGIFIQREPERRAIRDKYRKAFFEDLGLTPNRDPGATEIDMAAQAQKVAGLMAKAQGLHEGEMQAVAMMMAEVAQLNLAVPFQATSPFGRPNKESTSIAALSQNFFGYRRR